MKQMEQINPTHQPPVHLVPTSRKAFSIIKGDFNPDEAREQVITLLIDKLKHYSLRSLTGFERTGSQDLESERKIKDLKADIEQVLNMLRQAESEGKSLRVESAIKISLI